MQQGFSLPTQTFDEPVLDNSLGGVTLLQIPVARQGQMEVDMVTIARTPGS
jgi:hypothetical protein